MEGGIRVRKYCWFYHATDFAFTYISFVLIFLFFFIFLYSYYYYYYSFLLIHLRKRYLFLFCYSMMIIRHLPLSQFSLPSLTFTYISFVKKVKE